MNPEEVLRITAYVCGAKAAVLDSGLSHPRLDICLELLDSAIAELRAAVPAHFRQPDLFAGDKP